MSHWITAGN